MSRAVGPLPRRVGAVVRALRVAPWDGRAIGIAVVTLVLLLTGLLMSFSASIVDAAQSGDAFAVLRRQATWAALGVPTFLVVASTDHRVWRRVAWPLFLGVLVQLLLLAVPGVGITEYGSTRWLGVGSLTFQPSELAKLALLVWVADVLERKRPAADRLQRTEHLLIPALPALGIFVLLVLMQPDLGTAIILGLIVGAVLWVEGLSGRWLALLSAGGLAGTVILALVVDYRQDRIRGWLRPELYPLDEGFQPLQSRFALGSGGLFGLGLGESRGKWNFIPNPDTDFVFAVIGEELGLVGATAVLLAFLALLWLGLHVAHAAADGFGRTVAFGVTVGVVGQALINVGTVIGLLPITGVTLPLVSAGGTSLLVTLVALGMLASIARDPATVRADRGTRGPRAGARPSKRPDRSRA
ncbi:MAG: putative lipid flippase FtsW [Actinomycetota bacterium]